MTTDPIDPNGTSTAPRLAIAATYKDPKTGALYLHQDLRCVQDPWAEEEHLPPVRAAEKFGDVESWAAYILRFNGAEVGTPLLTWNARGLRAILDYHGDAELGADNPAGRCQWTAECPFTTSHQWQQWCALASERSLDQKAAVEQLEDLGGDIVEPAPTDLMALLRNLRATVRATAQAELRPDGTTNVAFSQDKTLKSGNLDLPPTLQIAIPVLRGDVDGDGRPVLYRIPIRVRVSVDDAAHLAFRFSIPTAERVLEAVYEDRVSAAKALLGDGLQLLRAAD